MLPIVTISIIVFSFSACGLFEADYIDYKEGEDPASPTPEDDECIAAALASFEAELQPGVKSDCATNGCHLNFSTRPLSPTDTESNREELLEYASGSADTLFNKLSASNEITHNGGDKSGAISKAQIETWLTKEAECK